MLIFGHSLPCASSNSRQAISQALGTVFFLSVGTLVCIYLILINGGTFEYQFLSFSLFLIVGIGGLWWVLSARLAFAGADAGERAVAAIRLLLRDECACGQAGLAGIRPAADAVLGRLRCAFGFAIAAMLVPLLERIRRGPRTNAG